MVAGSVRNCISVLKLYPGIFPSFLIHSLSSLYSINESVKSAVESKSYKQIPDILMVEKSGQVPNPFSFLSTFPSNVRTQIINEILQSFRTIRPRSRPHIAYELLLSFTLQSTHPFPLSLAVLQGTLRSGCLPNPQIRLFLSSAWLNYRIRSISDSLMEMQDIGYDPDCLVCNFLISSLCAVDQLEEAVKVLKGMSGAGCFPNHESYASLITSMCGHRRTGDVAELIKEMVQKARLTPRQETVAKVVATLRDNREIWKAVEMIEFLEREGNLVGFESYELAIRGCLECYEYILAGKVCIAMTERGFIPCIEVRQKVVEGLVNADELKLAASLRERFSELGS